VAVKGSGVRIRGHFDTTDARPYNWATMSAAPGEPITVSVGQAAVARARAPSPLVVGHSLVMPYRTLAPTTTAPVEPWVTKQTLIEQRRAERELFFWTTNEWLVVLRQALRLIAQGLRLIALAAFVIYLVVSLVNGRVPIEHELLRLLPGASGR